MRKLIFLIFLPFLFSTTCIKANKAKPKIAYCTKLTGIISPYFSYLPRGKINKEQAVQLSHYKVIYDEQDRIINLAFYKGKHPNNYAYYGPHQVKIDYEKQQIRRTYYDTKGNKAPLWRHYYKGDTVYEEVFFLNEAGQKERLILLDSLGNRVSTQLGAYEYQFETLADGNFIQQQFDKTGTPIDLTDYFPFPIAKIVMDQKGHLYSITNLDSTATNKVLHPKAGYAEVIFDFDEYGNELGWKFLDAQGNLSNRQPIATTDSGYAVWKYTMDWTNRSLGLYEKMTEWYEDEQGIPIANNYQIHKVIYRANQWDDLTAIEFFGLNNKPINHPQQGHAKLVLTYDDKGNPKGSQRYDSIGNLLE